MLAALAVSACQYSPEKNEDSPYYAPVAGSRLHLKQTLFIPAHRASIYLQGGRVVPFSEMDQYYPHCKFELGSVSDVKRTVTPQSFTIKKVKQWIESSISFAPVASRFGASSVVGYQPYSTIMYLEGGKLKDVYAMNCSHWEDPPDGEFLTIRQIRSSLGHIFELELAS